MYKQFSNRDHNEPILPRKRAKLELQEDLSNPPSKYNKKKVPGKGSHSEDIWGDDFGEDDIKEIDMVASQATLQTSGIIAGQFNDDSIQVNISSPVSSTSKDYSIRGHGERSSSINKAYDKEYMKFENKLLRKNTHDSTFVLQDSALMKEFDKLKSENDKLLNDFITKDGETFFLRNQLQQLQLRADNEKLEKTRFIEEQNNRYREEINAVCKEKEKLQTQLELQALQIANLTARSKLLAAGKLSEPHTSDGYKSFTDKPHRSLNQVSTNRLLKLSDTSIQTKGYDGNHWYLKTKYTYYPLANVPKSIFCISSAEKPVVDIQIIEKIRKRNLPILQEEKMCRIYENPNIVKPTVTTINERKLTIEFVLPEFAALQKKTSTELSSEDCTHAINKIISTVREVMINGIAVLETLSKAMKNDDIRDMDDLYFSGLYNIPADYTKCVCDPTAWYDEERSIDTRRLLAMLAYITVESLYLSNYIAGKVQLHTNADPDYLDYSKQMLAYNEWPKKNCEFEMLEIILEFVTLIGHVRRSHQFGGLITAISMLLCNAQRNIDFCSKGIYYVSRIFKELVLSRPLPFCMVPLANIMVTFVKNDIFGKNLCNNLRTAAIHNWKGIYHFTPDACALQILIAQMDQANLDADSTFDVTFAIIKSAITILQRNYIPLRTDNSQFCRCCEKLIVLTVKFSCNCSKIVLNDKESATLKKDKPLCVLREAINFLCYFATRDPDVLVRLSEIEGPFHIFIQNISNLEDVVIHEKEREALQLIKSTLIFDKSPRSEGPAYNAQSNTQILSIKENFKQNDLHFGQDNGPNGEDLFRIFSAYKSLFNNRTQ